VNNDVGAAGTLCVILRVPVTLEDEIVEDIRRRLCELTEKDVTLDVRVDPELDGALLEIGPRTRIAFDFGDVVGRLERDIRSSLGDGEATGPERVADAAADAASAPLHGVLGTVQSSGLWQALSRMKGSSAQVRTRVPVDPGLAEVLGRRLSDVAERQIQVEFVTDPSMESEAVLQLGPDMSIDLDTHEQMLESLESALAQREKSRLRSADTAEAYVAQLVRHIRPTLRLKEATERGYVEQIGDGIAIVRGLRHVGAQEVVQFEAGPYGIAFNLLENAVGCIMLGAEDAVDVGTAVQATGRLLEIPTGPALVGRTVNALGYPLDGKGPVPLDNMRQVERVAPSVVRRQQVSEPLHTGIKTLDALVPLGRGQRELVLGDRKIGKTTLAIDTILSQKGHGVVCVYAAIGQKATTVARVLDILRERGAMEYTVLVVAFSNEEPAFRYLVPYTACTIAEQVMDSGGHSFVVFDDLSKHAVTYREMSALLKRPIGREAYPGDVFYIHSRLLERAARLRDDLGGGSMTAMPIVETLAGDISAFIPTNVISISDGQIMLDSGLFNEGFRPAMDAGLSVSRVGGMAQTPAMKKVAGRLRIDLAQYEEMAQFVKFGAEVDQATLDQLTRGERERELLKQDQHCPMPLEEEVAILFAAVNGYTDTVPLDELRVFEEEYLRFLESRHQAVLAAIRDTRDLAAATEESLHAASQQFVREFESQRAAARPAVR